MKFKNDIEAQAGFKDAGGDLGVAGQLLSSTGTGTEWVSLSEISGVDGTGTANYVAKWSDTDTASAAKVGTLKYRVSGNNSYVDMCMQTGAATYEWVNIVQNNW